MTETDIKVVGLNALAYLVTWTNAEMILKIILLVISILYTILKVKKELRNEKD